VQKLWSAGNSYFNNVDRSQFGTALDNVRKIVQQFATDARAFGDDGYDGRNCSLMGTDAGKPFHWSVTGSMLFATTIYTTVGLCHIYFVNNFHSFSSVHQSSQNVSDTVSLLMSVDQLI